MPLTLRSLGLCLVLSLAAVCTACAKDNHSAATQKYQSMLATSSELREADQSIRETLAEAQKILPPDEYKRILARQEVWKEQEFLPNVNAYKETGLTEAQAWAMEVGNHADSLSLEVDMADLRLTAKGQEGVYSHTGIRSGHKLRGTLLLRKVDGEYSLSILVEEVDVFPPKQCTFSGTGTLRGKELAIVMEDEPDSALKVTLDGKKATVDATSLANSECDSPLCLDGVYSK